MYKEIIIEDIDPRILWGSFNINLKKIEQKFPTVKMVSRGSSLLVNGPRDEIEKVETLIQAMIRNTNKNDYSLDIPDSINKDIPLNNDSENEKKYIIVYGNNGRIIKAKTANQKQMVDHISSNDILFAIGPAGTGKTYTAVALAVKALKNKEIKRIILARPAVEAGESLGFLPGDLKEKIDPYLRPLYDALDDMIAPEKLKYYIENRTIEIAPMAFMRGRTLDNAYVILDEAQNATDLQLKMFLTRMGPNAKFIITGDLTQIDLPKRNQSGLLKASTILNNIKGIQFTYLTFDDVVRHKLVRDIIKAYDVNNE